MPYSFLLNAGGRSLFSLAFFATVATSALSACSSDESNEPTPQVDAGVDSGPSLTLTPTISPVTDLPAGAIYASAVPYGTDPMQVVDVFLPAATAPTAAVLYIHGGGFTAGSRAEPYKSGSGIRATLAAGVAVISVEYRLLLAPGTETEGVIKSLHDCERALQFVRSNAAALNIDPTRVGSTGVSAGAGASMWLAYHDDMADPTSADPIARQSTRLKAISAVWPQATYDILRWAPDVFAGEYAYITNDTFLSVEALRVQIIQFYGLDIALKGDSAALLAALNTPKMLAYRADVDMLAELSADDAPTYLAVEKPDLTPLDAQFDVLHHPLHALTVYNRANAVQTTVSGDIPAYSITSGAAPGSDAAFSFVVGRLAAP